MANINDYRNDDEIDDILEISLADMLRNPVQPLPPPPPPPRRRNRDGQPVFSCEIADFLNSASVSSRRKIKMRRLDEKKTENETRKNALVNDIRIYRDLIKEAQKQLKKLEADIHNDIRDINELLDE